MRFVLVFTVLSLLAIPLANAQLCPQENAKGPSKASVSRTLSGTVVYHDEIRQWFGLKLDAPVCGEREIQLLQGGGAFEVDGSNAHSIETFRGCRVIVDGPLGIPGTGYYSADLYQDVEKINPEKGCVLEPPLPDFSKATPDKSVRSYQVSMRLDYSARGGHIDVTVKAGDHLLKPWQAYASY